jgi:two-component system response regulator GlrR
MSIDIATNPFEPPGGDSGDYQVISGFGLHVLDGPQRGEVWDSSSTQCILGSSESCDFVLHHDTVSRRHCGIFLREGRFRVRDLGGRNGTIIDGLRLVEGFPPDECVIQLGAISVRFQVRGERRVPLSGSTSFGELVGESRAMRAVFATLRKAAMTDLNILLQGETGTGKTAAARSIHQESPRRDRPFVIVDCSTLQETLLASELFGHERGAFTDAHHSHEGAFEAAAGGTIFLDEIGELLPSMQAKLLTAIGERTIRRLGSNTQIPVDVRVIAATHHDLSAAVNGERFRDDLYYRLAEMTIPMPALRERPEDLPLLAQRVADALLPRLRISQRRVVELLDDHFFQDLLRHEWPGNIRQLRNHIIEHLVFRDGEPVPRSAEHIVPQGEAIKDELSLRDALGDARIRAESAYALAVLERFQWNVTRAAEHAEISRSYFHRLMRKHGITPPDP